MPTNDDNPRIIQPKDIREQLDPHRFDDDPVARETYIQSLEMATTSLEEKMNQTLAGLTGSPANKRAVMLPMWEEYARLIQETIELCKIADSRCAFCGFKLIPGQWECPSCGTV